MNAIKIINFIREQSITKEEFCKLCNITTTMLDDIIYYGEFISFEVCERVADVMEVGVYELYTHI